MYHKTMQSIIKLLIPFSSHIIEKNNDRIREFGGKASKLDTSTAVLALSGVFLVPVTTIGTGKKHGLLLFVSE